MIVAIMGLIGSGKSTVAAIIAARRDMLLFDMDIEFPEEYRERHRQGEVVPASDVKIYQRPMVQRMIDFSRKRKVIMAGFFLDHELPKLIGSRTSVLWINLVTGDKKMLMRRIQERKNHFAAGLAVLEDNWPNRADQIIGTHMVDCGKSIDNVVNDCVAIIDKYE